MNTHHYVTGIPSKPLPKGRVLVHNHVRPRKTFGMGGFRVWTQTLDDTLEVCIASLREWTFEVSSTGG